MSKFFSSPMCKYLWLAKHRPLTLFLPAVLLLVCRVLLHVLLCFNCVCASESWKVFSKVSDGSHHLVLSRVIPSWSQCVRKSHVDFSFMIDLCKFLPPRINVVYLCVLFIFSLSNVIKLCWFSFVLFLGMASLPYLYSCGLLWFISILSPCLCLLFMSDILYLNQFKSVMNVEI